jgi:hypothetical protein
MKQSPTLIIRFGKRKDGFNTNSRVVAMSSKIKTRFRHFGHW